MGPRSRAKPERPYSVLRDRSDLINQFKELIKQFVALIIIDAAVHSKVIISAEPMDVVIHFGLRKFFCAFNPTTFVLHGHAEAIVLGFFIINIFLGDIILVCN